MSGEGEEKEEEEASSGHPREPRRLAFTSESVRAPLVTGDSVFEAVFERSPGPAECPRLLEFLAVVMRAGRPSR